MKKLLLLFIGFCFVSVNSFAFDFKQLPAPSNYVNDYAQLLSTKTVKKLNHQLKGYQQQTSNQIVVAIFPGHVPDGSIEAFATRLENEWKIGGRGKDNGVLLIIFPDDRQLRIEVGYGLEGVLPDTLAQIIINEHIIPYFKRQQYGRGVTSGVGHIIQTITPDYKLAAAGDDYPEMQSIIEQQILMQVIFGLLIGFLIGRGVGPGFALIFVISVVGWWLGILFWLAAFFVYAILYHLLPKKYRFNHPWAFLLGGFAGNVGSDWWRGGGRWGGGGSGGFGGGGFGGGGGGSSGGGGASGRW